MALSVLAELCYEMPRLVYDASRFIFFAHLLGHCNLYFRPPTYHDDISSIFFLSSWVRLARLVRTLSVTWCCHHESHVCTPPRTSIGYCGLRDTCVTGPTCVTTCLLCLQLCFVLCRFHVVKNPQSSHCKYESNATKIWCFSHVARIIFSSDICTILHISRYSCQ